MQWVRTLFRGECRQTSVERLINFQGSIILFVTTSACSFPFEFEYRGSAGFSFHIMREALRLTGRMLLSMVTVRESADCPSVDCRSKVRDVFPESAPKMRNSKGKDPSMVDCFRREETSRDDVSVQLAENLSRVIKRLLPRLRLLFFGLLPSDRSSTSVYR